MPNNSFKHLINGLAFKLCFFNYFCCFYFFYLYLISAHDIYDFDENDYQSIFGREKSKSTPLDSHKKSNKLLDKYNNRQCDIEQSLGQRPYSRKNNTTKDNNNEHLELRNKLNQICGHIIDINKCVTEMRTLQTQSLNEMKQEMQEMKKDFHEYINTIKASKKKRDFPTEIMYEKINDQQINLLLLDAPSERDFVKNVMKEIFSIREINSSIIKSKNSKSSSENFDPIRINKLKG